MDRINSRHISPSQNSPKIKGCFYNSQLQVRKYHIIGSTIKYDFTLNNHSNELNHDNEIAYSKLDTCNIDQKGKSITMEEGRDVLY